MLLLHYFLDSSITGSCDEKDHCPGEQDCLRRHQHLILKLPFLSFLVKKKHLMWPLTLMLKFLSFPPLQFFLLLCLHHYCPWGWSTDWHDDHGLPIKLALNYGHQSTQFKVSIFKQPSPLTKPCVRWITIFPYGLQRSSHTTWTIKSSLWGRGVYIKSREGFILSLLFFNLPFSNPFSQILPRKYYFIWNIYIYI